ncbi:hypothetical protein LZK78_27125 (plasmid) [Rhizobium leguminosarum]|nr:hypothetical protein LZK78_27125 [Rhizobium leguminosarum]
MTSIVTRFARTLKSFDTRPSSLDRFRRQARRAPAPEIHRSDGGAAGLSLNDLATGPNVLAQHGLANHPARDSVVSHDDKNALIRMAQSSVDHRHVALLALTSGRHEP